MTAKKTETEILDPVPSTYTMADGFVVSIEPLKTRQFFRLVRIFTQGASIAASGGDISSIFSGNGEAVGSQLIGLAIVAIPEAEDASLDFLRSMVAPADLRTGTRLSQEDEDHNDREWAKVDAALFNPSPVDTLGLIKVIIQREKDSLASLGKQLVETLQATANQAEPLNASNENSTN